MPEGKAQTYDNRGDRGTDDLNDRTSRDNDADDRSRLVTEDSGAELFEIT